MTDNNPDIAITFKNMDWDTDFFGVTCGKAILHKEITPDEWNDLKDKFHNYQFVSIENRNSNPGNAQFIGTDTTAFLADVNIQFLKKIDKSIETSNSVQILRGMEKEDKIFEIADFRYSKFIEDPNLAKRGGTRVYRQWLLNSFGKNDKFFAVSRDDKDEINGFLLHSYSDTTCIIELIAVSTNSAKGGIGTNLFKETEFAAMQRGYTEIKVGTQGRNMNAINFYHKCGCKQIECHQIFHLWNI